jgi:hypothetical protein
MTTTFAELYPLIRVILGDTDLQVIRYSDAVLASQIRLRLLTDNYSDVQEDGNSATFAAELTANQKALIVLKVAKAIVAPMANSFSYRNPVQSVSRSGSTVQLLAYLDEQISDLESSVGKTIRFDTEIAAILNGALRFYSDYADALIADGSSS